MTSKCMSSVVGQVSNTPCYLIGSNRILPTGSTIGDYSTVVIGLSLFVGVLLDFNEQMCGNTHVGHTNSGRILSYPCRISAYQEFPLGELLTYLDELDDVLIRIVSSEASFKAKSLHNGVRSVSGSKSVSLLKGIISSIVSFSTEKIKDGERGALTQLYKSAHQVFSFLKKLDVSRPDLEEEMHESFLNFEEGLVRLQVHQEQSPEYAKTVSSMRKILAKHLGEFHMDPFVPKHGPGAVSDANVRSWYDKNCTVRSDRRLSYLLDHEGLGMERDYLPAIGRTSSSRTSRYITVPKTWKKLRGISAEPAELQFWQQGVLGRIDSMFQHDEWWSSRVNLHCQQRSRDEALLSSITGSYATVDLSSASDSVSLQLVKDVFGNTSLARWLLGTRSTHTLCGDTLVKVRKFSPMGSACCFPVECIIFVLAAEVACSRTPRPLRYAQEVVVYGDDIILPYYAVDELLEVLSILGFSINMEKSYWDGNFREACGVEAWYGTDIAPCRYKSYTDEIGNRMISHSNYASLLALANDMFARGLHTARAWLLDFLFTREVQLHNTRISVQEAIFASFSGERNTLASPSPTNFQLRRKFDKTLWTQKVRRLTWQRKPKYRNVDPAMAGSMSVFEYTEWLIRHQAGTADYDRLWEDGWVESVDENPYDRLPVDQVMVPTLQWVLPPRCFHLGW